MVVLPTLIHWGVRKSALCQREVLFFSIRPRYDPNTHDLKLLASQTYDKTAQV